MNAVSLRSYWVHIACVVLVAFGTSSWAWELEPGESQAKPFLGVGIRQVENTRVTTLYPNSTALELGIKLGDILLSIQGKEVKNLDGVRRVLKQFKIGDEVTVSLRRNDQQLDLGPKKLKSKKDSMVQ